MFLHQEISDVTILTRNIGYLNFKSELPEILYWEIIRNKSLTNHNEYLGASQLVFLGISLSEKDIPITDEMCYCNLNFYKY